MKKSGRMSSPLKNSQSQKMEKQLDSADRHCAQRNSVKQAPADAQLV